MHIVYGHLYFYYYKHLTNSVLNDNVPQSLSADILHSFLEEAYERHKTSELILFMNYTIPFSQANKRKNPIIHKVQPLESMSLIYGLVP